MENLCNLANLSNLDLSNNDIRAVADIAGLSQLHTLNLSRNKLRSVEDVEILSECGELTVLDLSYNGLDDPGVVGVLKRMPSLKVLTLMGNPIVRSTKDYRYIPRLITGSLKCRAFRCVNSPGGR